MECPHCTKQTPGIVDGNQLWCSQCGTAIRPHFEYVQSFQNRHDMPRQQVYSRLKRFTKWIQKMNRKDLLKHIYDILDLYSAFEFAWILHKEKSVRSYFYAKPVMLQVCTEMLGLQPSLPHLKDHSRELDQKMELEAMVKTKEWELRYNSLSTKGFL